MNQSDNPRVLLANVWTPLNLQEPFLDRSFPEGRSLRSNIFKKVTLSIRKPNFVMARSQDVKCKFPPSVYFSGKTPKDVF